MLSRENLRFMLNWRERITNCPENYQGISSHRALSDIDQTSAYLADLAFEVSEITDRECGKSEFFMTHYDAFRHAD